MDSRSTTPLWFVFAMWRLSNEIESRIDPAFGPRKRCFLERFYSKFLASRRTVRLGSGPYRRASVVRIRCSTRFSNMFSTSDKNRKKHTRRSRSRAPQIIFMIGRKRDQSFVSSDEQGRWFFVDFSGNTPIERAHYDDDEDEGSSLAIKPKTRSDGRMIRSMNNW